MKLSFKSSYLGRPPVCSFWQQVTLTGDCDDAIVWESCLHTLYTVKYNSSSGLVISVVYSKKKVLIKLKYVPKF